MDGTLDPVAIASPGIERMNRKGLSAKVMPLLVITRAGGSHSGEIMRRAAALLGSMVLGVSTMLGAATMLAPAAQASTSPVVIREIFYNSPGRDTGSNSSLNAEWVQLHNRTNRTITLTHWTLRDRAGHVYRFGVYRIKP